MFKILLLLFIVVPLVELTLLLKLADSTTWEFTLGLVILPGIFGTILARSQGWRTWRQIQKQLSAGQLPGDSIVDALLILVAGASPPPMSQAIPQQLEQLTRQMLHVDPAQRPLADEVADRQRGEIST